MTTLRIDLETYSSRDIRDGVHAYVEAADFTILLMAYAFGEEPVAVIDFANGESIPADVADAITNPAILKSAFNAAFEITCLRKYLGNDHICATQWVCTSVRALYLGLPGKLSDVGQVIGLPIEQQKLRHGAALIRYFCVPCKPSQANGMRTRNLPHHDPQKWALFKQYCEGDVIAERAIAQKIEKFPLPAIEQRLWELDQRMNNYGILVDRALVDAAIEADAIAREQLVAEAVKLTQLPNPNSRDQLLAWLREAENDAGINDLTKKSIPALLEKTESDIVRRVLELRQALSKTSVAKYQAIARSVCQDQRLRGLTQFYGANRTGRWAGRIVNIQNLPQDHLPDLSLARELIRQRRFDDLDLLFGSVPDTLSQLIRSMFIAPAGHRFIVADFSAIEARVAAWLAACQWRLNVFRTHGKIYEASAEQMFKLPQGSVTKSSPYRVKGKISELALGFGGGVNALKTMGGLELGLSEPELERIKLAWRESNPEIVRYWYDCEHAAKQAVLERTRVKVNAGPSAWATLGAGHNRHQQIQHHAEIVFIYQSGFLFITLPSGRQLAYVKPRIEADDLYLASSNTEPYLAAKRGALTYEGLDQRTKRWTRMPTWGGRLFENIVQAIARDCLREAMLALDARGYQQIVTVHDEIVIEAPEGFGSLDEVMQVMGTSPSWAHDLPMRADAFETQFYGKEPVNGP